jgi:hypothetical protein
VIDLASREFSFLSGSRATVDVVPGDARLRLAAEQPQQFDVLVVDAFTSDAIPVHLCTREAIALYRSHLASGGVIAFNVSNRGLDLEPVLGTHAAEAGSRGLLIANDADDAAGVYAADWILLAADPAPLAAVAASPGARILGPRLLPRPWTDQFSSVGAILK